MIGLTCLCIELDNLLVGKRRKVISGSRWTKERIKQIGVMLTIYCVYNAIHATGCIPSSPQSLVVFLLYMLDYDRILD